MKRYLVSVDQSTSASKAFLIDAEGRIMRRASVPHRQHYPAPGRVEHDAEEIFQNVLRAFEQVTGDVPAGEIAALAISNQRETTVVWDRKTGHPVAPAIVWQDVRGEPACRNLASEAEEIQRISGLPLSPYFTAGKLATLFEERPELRTRAADGDICIGTMDSYLAFRLGGGVHATDATNASRTQLMDLNALRWSERLLSLFGIPAQALPERIQGADERFGEFRGIPIAGVLGDSHAALYGQGCHRPGMAKATYGTGSSVMMHVGESPVLSRSGLSASVAFRVNGRTHYALEGNVTCSGDALRWLCDEMALFESPDEIERLAAQAGDSGGVTLVPAFSGLGTPYFDSDARALLCGMSRGTTRAHVAYAALEAIAQQDADVLERMSAESGHALRTLFADGGPTRNALLMQMQADISGCEVRCASDDALSALGAAYIAGLAVGFFPSFEKLQERRAPGRRYAPRATGERRAELRARWQRAVNRARG